MKGEDLLRDPAFIQQWYDYFIRGHLSHYGTLDDRLKKHGSSLAELLWRASIAAKEG